MGKYRAGADDCVIAIHVTEGADGDILLDDHIIITSDPIEGYVVVKSDGELGWRNVEEFEEKYEPADD